MLQMLLESCGGTVRVAATADAALRLLRRGGLPDAVITDLSLPRHDGYWLLAQLRKLPFVGADRVPVLAITGHVDYEARHRALAAGFRAHLPKPIDADSFCRTIAELTGRVA
jgi:CheY-like chemotaxis protein